jgi:hypothetical protein
MRILILLGIMLVLGCRQKCEPAPECLQLPAELEKNCALEKELKDNPDAYSTHCGNEVFKEEVKRVEKLAVEYAEQCAQIDIAKSCRTYTESLREERGRFEKMKATR